MFEQSPVDICDFEQAQLIKRSRGEGVYFELSGDLIDDFEFVEIEEYFEAVSLLVGHGQVDLFLVVQVGEEFFDLTAISSGAFREKAP